MYCKLWYWSVMLLILRMIIILYWYLKYVSVYFHYLSGDLSVYNYTSTKSWRGYIFIAVCLCVCVCVCVCPEFLWTKFQPNGCTDLDAVFAKQLLTTLSRTLLKLVTLGQRSRSRWPKMYVKMMKKNRQKFIYRHFLNQISFFDWKLYCRHFDTKHDHVAK